MQMETAQPFGKYLLLECVAVGGMAEIFRAKTVGADGFEKEVAIKRILPSYSEDDGFVTMFKDEAKIAAQLDHANIVKIFDFDEVDGDYYIAMELIRGTDLKRLLEVCDKNHKRFTFTQICYIIIETAKALDYAHKRTAPDGSPLNIVHRDATPHNIMVSFDGDVKLMDFGIAKAASRATKTRAGTVKGKCAYMSPEQARGKPLDGRSDMFSLGILTWEMLTGRRLFSGGSDFDVLSKVLKSEIVDPREFDANIPEELALIVLKMLERDRDHRFVDCGEMMQTLNGFLYGNCADVHNPQLGYYVQCLSDVHGHRPGELPDYYPAAPEDEVPDLSEEKTQMLSIEEMEAKLGSLDAPRSPQNDFDQIQNSAKTMPLDQERVDAFLQQQNLMAPPPQMMPPQYAQAPGMSPYGPVPTYGQMPGMPPGMMPYGQPPPQKSNVALIVAIAVVFLLIIGGAVGAWFYISKNKAAPEPATAAKETKEDPRNGAAEAAPVSYVTIKTMPPGAFVSINGRPQPNQTPIFGYQANIGDSLKLAFSMEGYESANAERRLIQQNQTIEVELIAIVKEPDEVADNGSSDTGDETNSDDGNGGTTDIGGDAAGSEVGTLVINSDPKGSSVKIDGKALDGVTPLTVPDLPLNKELSIAVNPKSRKFHSVTRAYSLVSTGENVLTITHKEREESESVSSGSDTADSRGSGSGPAEITLNAIPWGQAYLDGKKLGTTPKKLDVEPGKHELEISFPAKQKKVNKTIKVKAGSKSSYTYDFNTDKWR
ncbi:MAG: hypothetical protein AUK47_25710 [Deltaproteobacteria bacterium CG2_30_63_29]|nr:MAG: hypothetical protein AUK47_25710 [Deltaproteobacteria bacterium CG2_30_63_29]PJB49363.1 MAG: hypothetical protein CO108_00090 [Deltaproteobacteria bacterium CG_4_9_14_3_um_filter_63_12]